MRDLFIRFEESQLKYSLSVLKIFSSFELNLTDYGLNCAQPLWIVDEVQTKILIINDFYIPELNRSGYLYIHLKIYV